MLIKPIDERQQENVISEAERYLTIATAAYQTDFTMIDIRFDLKGKTAGMYKVKQINRNHYQRVLRFNPWLFAKYPEDSWENTIPHEVAHYVVDCLHGVANVKPHGKEWRAVMQCFNVPPIVTANYDFEGIPIKKMQRYAYRCGCREVLLSQQRHRKVQQLAVTYRCRDCGEVLQHVQHCET